MKNSYLKSFGQFFSANFIVRLISLIREIILAWFIGPSKLLDTFFFITTVPNLVNATWNKAIETVLLTKYEKDVYAFGNEKSKILLVKSISTIVVFSFIIYLLLSITFPIILFYFYSDIFLPSFVKAVFFVNIAFFIETYIIAIKIVKFSEHNFFLPSIIPGIQSVIMILGIIFLKDKLTVLYLSLLYSLGSVFQLLIIFKKEFSVLRQVFKTNFNFKIIKDIFRDSSKLSLAAGISSLNLFIDQSFALSLGESANSYIHYGNYFLTVYSVLFVRNINTIFFPQFQKYVFQQKDNLLISDTKKIIKFILLLGVFIIIMMINHGYLILNYMLGHGKVNEQDIRIIYYCTLGYGGAFFGTAINAILIRVLHVYAEYKIIIKIAIVNFISNIVLNYILSNIFGVWGLAISTSITILLVVIIYFIYLSKKRDLKIFSNDIWYVKYIIIVLLLMGMELLLYWYINSFLQLSLLVNLYIFGISFSVIIILFSFAKFIDIKNFKIYFK